MLGWPIRSILSSFSPLKQVQRRRRERGERREERGERERGREEEGERERESIVRKTLLLIVEIVFVFCFHFWSSETVGYSILLTCSNTLDNITQGPHHVAKKSMTMVFSLLDIATSSSWVVSFCTCDKKKRKQNKKQFKKQQERLGSSKTIKQFSSSSTSTF